MCNIANAAAIAVLEGNPLTIHTEDQDLYRLMVDLELNIFRARLEFIVTNDRTTKMKKHLTTIGDIYAKIETIMGGNPPSTGSRRCRLRHEHDPGLLCGDTRATRKLGSDQRPGTPDDSGVGDTTPQRPPNGQYDAA